MHENGRMGEWEKFEAARASARTRAQGRRSTGVLHAGGRATVSFWQHLQGCSTPQGGADVSSLMRCMDSEDLGARDAGHGEIWLREWHLVARVCPGRARFGITCWQASRRRREDGKTAVPSSPPRQHHERSPACHSSSNVVTS